MCNQRDFSDIAPFSDEEFSSKMATLVEEPGFEHAVRYVMPDVDYPKFTAQLCAIRDKDTFQRQVMYPFLKGLQAKTTDGISFGGAENIADGVDYTYMSNHRDIVLDASFLNLCLIESGHPTCEIAIGSNLLIFNWITDLVKLNKSFIVKRNIQRAKALEAAKELSGYIHYAIADKKQSVWIAQREGRAKDSNDLTQVSLIKMLALEGDGSFIDNLKSINVMPLSISYEYDPNDYLKAREFLLRKLDPEYRKSQHDDLLSMETGLLSYKGRIHFQMGHCITDQLAQLPQDMPKADAAKAVCQMIDREIHAGYMIYPINYVAYDRLHKTDKFIEKYTPQQAAEIDSYFEAQLDKVDLPDISTLDREFMREMMYAMYANPLANKINVK